MKGLKFILGLKKQQEPTSMSAAERSDDAGEGMMVAPLIHKSRRHPLMAWLSASAGIALLTVSIMGAHKYYVEANTEVYYRVLVQGKEIGTISDKERLKVLFEEKRREYQNKYPDEVMVLETEGIVTEAASGYKPVIDNEQTLDKLEGQLKAYAVGVSLVVDGKAVGIVKDQESVQAVLQGVKDHYISGEKEASGVPKLAKTAAVSAPASSGEKIGSADIREQISIQPVKADPTKVLDVEAAVKLLTEGVEAPLVYTVQEGDTVSTIASRYGIAQQDIFRNNPNVKELTLQIGDELKLTVPQPPVTVVTTEKMTEQIVTEPEVIERTSDLLPKGKRKVVRPGQTGLKEMEYRLTKENGEVVKEEWLGQKVLKAPLPEVVYQGTKAAYEASGSFAWPVSSAIISSTFGERWGRPHKGLDIVSGNRTIKAADAGTVSFAGVQNGYGNVVIINHGNGYATYYGHLSEISVSPGQKLEQGAAIGIMGNTGRSTGTHLHFEIRKNGTAMNPLKYLQ
ncbi:murein DD-endopeptidase MepM/ murein hydrolase activator NlpD [Paenibacillus forsythiae]|uniref:Murein DD-endopeptidase MepM/ murein hydrolase activator NlpD n=1 Tax=Paenibacillus forsythiae TaxID=365616 RepID=A0ABU3H360_9BACL|nr:peptidoglycan DD-metalloendopeptidase family protein [Paenibacillus forsythiae]MDT3425257.1 murein DD-endopeptidase MepM/ murein hydrolase activator NlpD [Paenibacillus forsythiae]